MKRLLVALLLMVGCGPSPTHIETFEGRVKNKVYVAAHDETELVPVMNIDSDGDVSLSTEWRTVHYPEHWLLHVMEYDSDGNAHGLKTIHVKKEAFDGAEVGGWFRKENRVFGEAPQPRDTRTAESVDE